jgi:flagellar basal-body rod modification protein FlgD
MSTGGVGSTGSSSSTSGTSGSSPSDPFGTVNLSDFMTLMIAQLQNQDPTDPVSNSDLLQQIGDMETIESNTQLNSTLTGLSLSDSLTAGSIMLGQFVAGTDSTGAAAQGTVDSVSVLNGQTLLNVGTQSVPLANVTQVLSSASAAAESAVSGS